MPAEVEAGSHDSRATVAQEARHASGKRAFDSPYDMDP